MNLRRPVFRLAVFAAILSGIAGESARAADPGRNPTRSTGSTSGAPTAPGQPAPRDWKKETTATCGMACRYHRANDNLVLQALYLVNKLKKVDDAIRDDAESDAARTALGGFCKTGSEDLAACHRRYKKFQSVALLEIRQAIGRNEDTIAKLTPGRKLDGSVDGVAVAFEGGEKLNYFPEVPTVAEMETLYNQGKLQGHGGKYTAAEVKAWSQELVIGDPRARFLDFQKTPAEGNPYQTEKSSYTLFMKRTDGAGNDQTDAKSVALFEQAKPEIEAFVKDPEVEAHAKTIAPKKLADEDALSDEAFREARSVLNSEIAKEAKKDGKPAEERKPASKPTPNPSASPAPSASPGPDGKTAETAGADAPPTDAGRDVNVVGTTVRKPSNYRVYRDDEKVAPPPELKTSRYIKYNLHLFMQDIENAAK